MKNTFIAVFGIMSVLASCSQSTPLCSVANCAGCCDVSGHCQGGTAVVACGTLGTACQSCAVNESCSLGLCSREGAGAIDAGPCAPCTFGELCTVDAGVTVCINDYDPVLRPHCDSCPPSDCGGANYCVTTGTLFYCAADCSAGQRCPIGYACEGIFNGPTTVTCSPSQPCSGNTAFPCVSSNNCEYGAQCVQGFCAPPCVGGFCGCQADADCGVDECLNDTCSITNVDCSSGSGCRSIRCVMNGNVGLCQIGRNCLPADGLTCADLK